ncbi:unnamed protein product [Heligmosomoides polygyrus]|uniref:protein-tyrosine-phosphatase n=1 Tax=Heligmosomoides polygyrus TaxID=6339 RepID=A0A3P7YID8_HELPZ|nr:unnamed protein product [Heligmosomoides polygyrus]
MIGFISETSSPTSTASSHSAQIEHAVRRSNVIMVAPHVHHVSYFTVFGYCSSISSIFALYNHKDTRPASRLKRERSLPTDQRDVERSGGTDDVEEHRLTSPRPLGRQQTAPSLPLATRLLYVGELVWQIDDTVFVGSQDAVANMNLLCRLNIEFVCDLCNEDGEEANRRRYDCPCLCPRRSQHFRYFLAMDVPETEKKCIDTKINMTVLFDQFCDLVERGRKAGKSVLVCSAKGRNRAPAFCAAYLISKERMTRQQAVAKVIEQMSTMRPAPNISDYMQRALMRYQSSKGIQGAHNVAHTIPLFSIKRTAWT